MVKIVFIQYNVNLHQYILIHLNLIIYYMYHYIIFLLYNNNPYLVINILILIMLNLHSILKLDIIN